MVGIFGVSFVEIVPPLGLEPPKNLIHAHYIAAVVRARLKHYYCKNKGVVAGAGFGCCYSVVAFLES